MVNNDRLFLAKIAQRAKNVQVDPKPLMREYKEQYKK